VTPTDDELVARCRDQADADAFAELVRRYRQPVFRVALSVLGHGFAGEAEEVAQEVFLRVHHAIVSFRGESQFSSWIYRIAFNQAINVKSRVRYRAPHVSDGLLEGMAAATGDPVERLESGRRTRLLAECVVELPEIYQAALRLHYWMQASIQESSELLGVPENTVKSYLYRARRLLHAMLTARGMRHV
jgi:RNA polymerase sigma-70 factor (ECF subfamily)